MRKLFTVVALVVTVVAALVAGPSSAAIPAPTAALPPIDVSSHLRVMGVGDSITAGGFGCCNAAYRDALWHQAWEVGQVYTWLYVGPFTTGSSTWRHAGVSGWRLDQMDAALPGWLATYAPDVVLLHGGIGDLGQGASGQLALDRLAALLDHALTADADLRIVVSDLMVPFGNTTWDVASRQARIFNAGVLAVVQAAGPRVTLARMSLGVSSRWLGDGLHPIPPAGGWPAGTRPGYQRMAWVWWQCLGPVISADGWQRGGEDPNEVPVPIGELCPA